MTGDNHFFPLTALVDQRRETTANPQLAGNTETFGRSLTLRSCGTGPIHKIADTNRTWFVHGIRTYLSLRKFTRTIEADQGCDKKRTQTKEWLRSYHCPPTEQAEFWQTGPHKLGAVVSTVTVVVGAVVVVVGAAVVVVVGATVVVVVGATVVVVVGATVVVVIGATVVVVVGATVVVVVADAGIVGSVPAAKILTENCPPNCVTGRHTPSGMSLRGATVDRQAESAYPPPLITLALTVVYLMNKLGKKGLEKHTPAEVVTTLDGTVAHVDESE